MQSCSLRKSRAKCIRVLIVVKDFRRLLMHKRFEDECTVCVCQEE